MSQDFDLLLKKQILAFDLRKKQTYLDRVMKEGEIKGYTSLIQLYKSVLEAKYLVQEEKKKSFKSVEASMKKFDLAKFGKKSEKELYNIYSTLVSKEAQAKNELCILKGTEQVFNVLNKDLYYSLTSMDILERLKTKEYPKDVELRINSGKCALKRPGGKQKFSCDNEIVEGTKYCKEHLMKYEPVLYTDIFPEEE